MIRSAIIGTGHVALLHAANHNKTRGWKLIACCDIDLEKAKTFARKHGIPRVYDDFREMLAKERPEAISVCTSDAAHAGPSIAALKAGAHVFCEKPLASSLTEAKHMLKAAKASGRINMVNFSYRASSGLLKAKELVERGMLGKIRHVEASYLQSWLSIFDAQVLLKHESAAWRLCKDRGGKGVLGDLGSHILDFATTVVGSIKTLRCVLKAHPIRGMREGKVFFDANNAAIITAEFENGAMGTIHTTQWATGHQNSLRLRVYGENGALEIDLDRSWNEVKVYMLRHPRGRRAPVKLGEWKSFPTGKTVSNWSRFVRSVRTGKPEAPTFEEGVRIQAYLEACFRSADLNGSPIPVRI